MSTITVTLAPDSDGTLHLPVPAEWRHQMIKVKAEMEPAGVPGAPSAAMAELKGFGSLRGKIAMSADFDEPLEDFKEYVG
jgi:hypothetical protein